MGQMMPSQIHILTSLLSDPQDLQKQAKKEYIKVYGLLCEMKGADAAEQVPKMVNVLIKRIQEGKLI